MNKALLIPIILQLVGIVVVIAEIIIPSGGALSALAIAVFGYTLYIVFTSISASVGFAFVIGDLILIPVFIYFGIKFMARSPVTLRTELSKAEGVTSQSETLEHFVNYTGRATTDLRPSGVAHIDDQRIDVVTRGEFIEKGSEISVVAVRGNQVIVKAI